jgi:hypothetical protein
MLLLKNSNRIRFVQIKSINMVKISDNVCTRNLSGHLVIGYSISYRIDKLTSNKPRK